MPMANVCQSNLFENAHLQNSMNTFLKEKSTNFNPIPMNQSYERLEKIIEWSGLSTHEFAMKIGMQRSENLYRIVRNKENIRIKLAMLILETYPQINREWLLYGTGEMEDKTFHNESESIPYFEPPHFEPIFNLFIPIFDAEKARRVTDAAMSPMIPMDALVAMKTATTKSIVYGKIYHVQTEDLSVVRIVRKSERAEDELILQVVNKEHYDDITINMSDILNIYTVTGIVTKLQ